LIVRAYLIISVALIACFFYLSMLNQGTIALRLSNSFSTEISVTRILIITFFAGFLLSYIISILKSGKSFIHNLRTKKTRKNIESSSALLKQAKKCITLGNWEKSEELLNKCISTSSHTSEPHTLLLEHYLDNGDYGKAFHIIDNLPSGSESELQILLLKVKALMAKKSYDRAIDILKIINEQEKCIETKRLIRDAYIHAARWEKAAQIQAEIVKSFKKGEGEDELRLSAQIDYEIAMELDKDGKRDESIKKLTELIKKGKTYTPPYIALGNIHVEMGKSGQAVELWKNGYEKTANPIFIFLLEEFYLGEEDPQSIITTYNKLLSSNADDPALHLLAGKLYMRLEMNDDAVNSFRKAEELGLESDYLTKLTGEIYFRKEYFKEAAKKFKDVLNIKRAVKIPFCCRSCQTISDEWKEKCPRCGEWDSFRIDIDTAETGQS